MEFQIAPAFAVPMVFAQLADCENLNGQLRELFLAREKEGDKYRNPDQYVYRNQTLFESHFKLFDWPQECVQRLRRFCLTSLYRAIGELNGHDKAMLQRLHIGCEAWFHITRKGGFFGAHNHPMHSWSGVYCVKHDGDDPDSRSGQLTFINPHATSTMYIDKANFDMHVPYSMGPRMIRMVPGQLILFPSWLLHEVLPYEGDSERITVALNARFRLAGEA